MNAQQICKHPSKPPAVRAMRIRRLGINTNACCKIIPAGVNFFWTPADREMGPAASANPGRGGQIFAERVQCLDGPPFREKATTTRLGESPPGLSRNN